jgi:hypothetical protein
MTQAEARRYIQQAERTGKFSEAKLRQAVDVLDAGALGSGDAGYVSRANDLLSGQSSSSMTPTAAKRVIQQAEKSDSPDEDKVRAAIRVLEVTPGGDEDFRAGAADYVRRGQALLEPEVEKAKPSDQKAMSERQARQFIQQAERLPADKIDTDRLQEAIDVLDAGTFGSGDARYVRRATNLMVKATDRATTTQEARESSPAVAGALPESARRTPVSSAQAERVAATGTRLPSDLLNRLDQAARIAGVDAEGVQSVIEAARSEAEEAAGGLTPAMRAQLQASGQTITPEMEAELFAPDPNAPTVEELVEEQIADWTTGAIGVPDGYVAVRDKEFHDSDLLERNRVLKGQPNPTRSAQILPRYYSGDEWQRAGMPPEKIIALQRQLESAGLIGEGTNYPFYAGVFDEATASAMKSVMGMANASGQTWEDQLSHLVANVPDSVKEARNAAKLANQFQAPAYIKPDYATLAQDVKGYMRQKLGREPTEEEMAELTGSMSQSYRAAYEAEVAGLRAEFNAKEAGLETGTAVTPGSVQGVNPVDRFAEQADQRFMSELNFIGGQEDMFEATQNIMAALTSASRIMGGR